MAFQWHYLKNVDETNREQGLKRKKQPNEGEIYEGKEKRNRRQKERNKEKNEKRKIKYSNDNGSKRVFNILDYS